MYYNFDGTKKESCGSRKMSDDMNVILEGFICPICKEDLKSPDQLISHFEKQHSEDPSVLKSITELVGKAKKIILKKESYQEYIGRSQYRSETPAPLEVYELGCTRNHTNHYKNLRSVRIEHFASETNMLLIRLDKLLTTDNPDRRQHEQLIVQWLDGSSVKLCPSCAKPFNITRRQHHCRLCGSVMCQNCSCFLTHSKARIMTQALVADKPVPEQVENESLRLCRHCLSLLEQRYALQQRRLSKPPLCALYSELRSLMQQTEPSCILYIKMCNSLYFGECTYNLVDTQTLRGTIAKQAECIDMASRKIAALAGSPREIKLHQSIRRAATIYLKDRLLCLPQLPSVEKLAMLRQSQPMQMPIHDIKHSTQDTMAHLSGWSPVNKPVSTADPAEADPIVVQMAVIRGYINEARRAMRFEEVALLESNLKELQKEYHQRHLNDEASGFTFTMK